MADPLILERTKQEKGTLPETNIFAPANGWLEYDCFLLRWPIFRGEPLVLGSVDKIIPGPSKGYQMVPKCCQLTIP